MSETLSPSRRLLDAKQVAGLLGCNWRTVYRNADLGIMPFGLKIGALRRWDAAELDKWIAAGCPSVDVRGAR